MHKNEKSFFWTGSLALFGFLFVDLGDKHTVIDCSGE